MQTPVTVCMGNGPNPMTTDVKLRLLPAAAATKDRAKYAGTLPDITLQLPRTTTIAELESGLQTTLPGMLDASRSWLARRLHPRHACGPLRLLVSAKAVKLEGEAVTSDEQVQRSDSDAVAVTRRRGDEYGLVPLPGQATLEYLLARRSEEAAAGAAAESGSEAVALELYFQEEGKYGFIDDDMCLLCCTGLCCCCEGLLLGSLLADSNKQQQPQQQPMHQNNQYYYQNGQPTGPAPLPPNNNYYTGNSYGIPPNPQPVYPPPLYPPQPLTQPLTQPVYGQPIYYNQPPPASYPPAPAYSPQAGKPTAL